VPSIPSRSQRFSSERIRETLRATLDIVEAVGALDGGSARSGRTFRLSYAPVKPGSLIVTVPDDTNLFRGLVAADNRNGLLTETGVAGESSASDPELGRINYQTGVLTMDFPLDAVEDVEVSYEYDLK